MMIDSQGVKNTGNASMASKGYCFYKSTNGIKRHLAVDTLGFPSLPTVQKPIYFLDADLMEMLSKNIDYSKFKLVNIPQITRLLDHGYHPEHLTIELKKIYPQNLIKIKFPLSKNSQNQKKKCQENWDFFQLGQGG
jgi:hypothetical protein